MLDLKRIFKSEPGIFQICVANLPRAKLKSSENFVVLMCRTRIIELNIAEVLLLDLYAKSYLVKNNQKHAKLRTLSFKILQIISHSN